MADKIKEFAGHFRNASRGAGLGVKLLAGAAVIGYAIKESLYTVEGGQRAIIFSHIGGIQNDIYSEGLHIRIPWFQYPIIYDIRSRPRRITSLTGSKDLQMVNIGLRVLARPDSSDLPKIYQKLGLDYDERVLPSIMKEVLKSVVAQFNASQLITMRQEVSLQIRRELTERAKDFGIILDDISITDLSFGKKYAAAVAAEEVAQQEAQRAAFLVEKAAQEREDNIVQAVDEAKAAKLNIVILEKSIQIPRSLSVKAASILKGFLNKNPEERLGCHPQTGFSDIQSHLFFRAIDWKQLEARQITPPFKPRVEDGQEVENFDPQFTAEPVQLTPDDPKILDTIDQSEFEGFEYVNPLLTSAEEAV